MVHEFKEGKDDFSQQHEMFRGRTAVFADQVVVGNASLRLKNVQLRDAGTYTCYIRTSKGKGNANLEYKTGGELLLQGGQRGHPRIAENKGHEPLMKYSVFINDQYQTKTLSAQLC